jgi:hypothetical protein
MPLSVRHKLTSRALQERETRATTATGFPQTYATISTALPCRRWPAGSAEQETAARLERLVTDIFLFAPEADVRRDDRLTVDGRSYTVVMDTTPSVPIYTRVLAEEVQTGT